MLLLAESMIEILTHGGGLIVNTQGILPEAMMEMARAAASSGARLTFRVSGLLLPETMKQVGRYGQGHVVFDVS